MALSGLTNNLSQRFPKQSLAYIDEVGISPRLRLKGLGKQLWNQVADDLKQKGCQIIITRTQPKVKMFPWWLKNGYQIIQSYGNNDPRVIIAKPIDYSIDRLTAKC